MCAAALAKGHEIGKGVGQAEFDAKSRQENGKGGENGSPAHVFPHTVACSGPDRV